MNTDKQRTLTIVVMILLLSTTLLCCVEYILMTQEQHTLPFQRHFKTRRSPRCVRAVCVLLNHASSFQSSNEDERHPCQGTAQL